jgi:hypothetical protein
VAVCRFGRLPSAPFSGGVSSLPLEPKWEVARLRSPSTGTGAGSVGSGPKSIRAGPCLLSSGRVKKGAEAAAAGEDSTRAGLNPRLPPGPTSSSASDWFPSSVTDAVRLSLVRVLLGAFTIRSGVVLGLGGLADLFFEVFGGGNIAPDRKSGWSVAWTGYLARRELSGSFDLVTHVAQNLVGIHQLSTPVHFLNEW